MLRAALEDDSVDEEEALALCEELGEELPEQSLEVAQIALRMHYSQNQGQGLHVTPEGTVPLANFLMGDGQVRAYAEGLRRLGAQGVVIRRLELANNALTDQGLVPLARALKCCSRLEHLDLSSNRIRREGCDALGRYLVDPNDEDGGCAISTLLMSKNNMGEAAARSVLKAMRDQVTVTELDLSSNKVGGGGVGQSLAELLEDNTTLQVRPPPASPLACSQIFAVATTQRLELGWNAITSKVCERIAPSLGRNTALQYLGLQWNAVGLNLCRSVPTQLACWRLSLHHCCAGTRACKRWSCRGAASRSAGRWSSPTCSLRTAR
eukprot:COSAG04_NODE_6345_length_1352_cov_0.935355_1_plen_323_part_00